MLLTVELAVTAAAAAAAAAIEGGVLGSQLREAAGATSAEEIADWMGVYNVPSCGVSVDLDLLERLRAVEAPLANAGWLSPAPRVKWRRLSGALATELCS